MSYYLFKIGLNHLLTFYNSTALLTFYDSTVIIDGAYQKYAAIRLKRLGNNDAIVTGVTVSFVITSVG